MAFQTLAALQNGKFCATDSFEKAHQNNKRMGEGRKSGAGGGEARALKWQARMLAFKALFRGFEWGPNHAYKIAPGIIEWLGTSRILKEMPTELSELIPDRTQLASTDAKPRGAGGWTFKRAFKYDCITSTEKELLNSGIRVQDEKFVLEDNAMIKYVKVLSVKNGDRTFFIHEGDHAAVIYDEALPAVGEEKKDTKLDYCQVEKIILVQQQNKSWLYFFPLWYTVAGTHRVFKTTHLKRTNYRKDTFSEVMPCAALRRQVLVVHSCNEKCVVTECQRMQHDPSNLTFEVVDQAAGFTTSNERSKNVGQCIHFFSLSSFCA